MAADPHALKELWLGRALASAGIDRDRWRPERGVAHNRPAIEAVYRYYGRLAVEHPPLLWAGMASLIGPAFYAGFMDLGGMLDRFYETTLLTMQKKIFEDQATMHMAYLARGVPAIEELHAARIVDLATLEAWRQIAAGEIERGNRTLLLREQRDIIDRFYVAMLAHREPAGSLFTYAMTLSGAPSVPGGRSYPERYPLVLALGSVGLRTPLADGNIAIFANRWRLIEEDTLPAYLAFVRDHAEQARALMGEPVRRRALPYRLLARAGRLLAAAIGRWGLTFRETPRRIGIRTTKPLAAAETGATVIDVTRPLQPGRVWMNPGRLPFDVTVRLPGARSYRAKAELAVADGPDRLAVQLPAAGLDDTERLLTAYAAEFVFPAAAVADWRAGAERRPSSDRDHSTHVFTPEPAGAVHLEFEVSHHVREGVFSVAAHFLRCSGCA